MKILYGVVGEGMGHAMRSRVILDHLTREHEVEVMASARAFDYLAKRYAGVNRIHGYHMIYEDNRFRVGQTVLSNILAGTTSVPRNIAAYFDLIKDFRPEVVISDFESWTYVYAKVHALPVFSIDNMQIINRCRHDPEVLAGYQTDFHVARTFVKSKLPFADAYLITTFFYPEVRKEKTKLFPPILRPEILVARPSPGDHLLVYQTAEGHEELARILADTGLECRIYGMRRDIAEEQVEGNLRYRPFSEQAFISDLASARGIIAGGGFTLLGEAMYLHKPVLSIPVGSHFEQILNALYLARLGYGRMADRIDAAAVRGFIDAIPSCEEALSRYQQDGNRLILDEIDHQLDRAASGMV